MTACSSKSDTTIVYHSYHSLPNGKWAKSDTITMEYPFDSVPETYRVFLELRNTSNYPYRNLNLIVQDNFPDSATFRLDSLSINLADSTGRWLGKGWGSIYQLSVPIKSVYSLHPYNYKIKIINNMIDANLEGINDMGIRMEKVSR